MYLLTLLPLEIVNIIAKEPDPEVSNYDYVKKSLLKSFKMTPEEFRQKIVSQKK